MLAAGDQRFWQIGDEVEQEEPIRLGDLRIDLARDDPCRHIVHYDQSVDEVRMVLGEARRNPCAAIMADQRDLRNLQRAQNLLEIARHVALVIPARRLVGLPVAAQVWSDNAVSLG